MCRGKVLCMPLVTMKPINLFIASKSKAALAKEFLMWNERVVEKFETFCDLTYLDNTLWKKPDYQRTLCFLTTDSSSPLYVIPDLRRSKSRVGYAMLLTNIGMQIFSKWFAPGCEKFLLTLGLCFNKVCNDLVMSQVLHQWNRAPTLQPT